MSAGIDAKIDGSGAIQVGGTDVITISSAGAVAIPQSLSVAGSLNTPNTFGFKNRIMNGAMGIWQRGTSGFTTLGNYSSDRWIATSGTSLSAVAQSTDVPSGFKYSLSVSGTNFPQIAQRIESVNCTDLVGQSVTISFWAKQTSGAGAGSLSVLFYYANSSDNFSGGVTQIGSGQSFTGTTGWVQYSCTFTSLPSQSVNGLQILLFANTSGAATVLFTGVQLEKGSTATSFDYRPYGQELTLCQRYYSKSYDDSVTPGTVAYNGAFTYTATQTAAGANQYTFSFKQTMRAIPTVTIYSPTTGASARITQTGTVDLVVVAENTGVGSSSFYVSSSVSAVGVWLRGQWVASAEL
jgi:hypothetical protein